MPELTDEALAELVSRAKAGDADAFGELYGQYARSIFRFLFAQLPNRQDAEDLAAEVFLKAWDSLPRYRERGYPFSAYLFRIARNALIDFFRRVKRRGEISVEDVGEFVSDGSSLRERISPKIEHQELYQKLSQLKESYRTVLILRFISELSPGETALVMKRSEGSVRVIQHRALNALRDMLNHEG